MKKFLPMKKLPPKVAHAEVYEKQQAVLSQNQADEAMPVIDAQTPGLKNALAEQADREYVKSVAPYAPHENLVQIVQAYKSPVWLTIGEVAKHIKMPLTKFGKLRHNGGPTFYELPEGLVLYNVHDVDEWVMSHLPLAIKAKVEETTK